MKYDMCHCEKMGYDSIKNGANIENCDFRIFGTKEGMKAWESGVRRAKNGEKQE